MSASKTRLALLAGLILPLALSSASLAQPAPPPPGEAGAMHRDHWRDPAERAAHMADHLRAALQLQPGQEAALTAFVASMRPPGDMDDHMRGMRGDDMRGDRDEADNLTAPQRMDRMLARLDDMHARLSARADAVKRFYAQLSPSQQKAFDALPMGRMGGHLGDHRHGGRFHHDGDDDGRPMGPGGPG
jgi:protein CpxP